MCARMTRLDHLYVSGHYGMSKEPQGYPVLHQSIASWDHVQNLYEDFPWTMHNMLKEQQRYKFVPSLASVLWEDSDIGVWVILKYH